MPQPSSIHPIKAAIDEVIAGLIRLRNSAPRIVGEADQADAEALATFVVDYARVVDAGLLAVGLYAESNFGSFGKRVDEDFRDQMLRAVDGNATHTLDDAGLALYESFHENRADIARQMRMDGVW
jgi:hypothetical protein